MASAYRINSRMTWAIPVGLLMMYSSWLLAVWPGVLGPDSYAILKDISDPGDRFSAGKTVVWHHFVKAFYGPTQRVEAPIIAQLLFAIAIQSRILLQCWRWNLKKSFYFLLVFVALAPHTLLSMGMLYPDGMFSLAVVAVLFELWVSLRRKAISRTSLIILITALPFALYGRTNGLVMLFPLAYVTYRLSGSERLKLISITLIWCVLIATASKFHKQLQVSQLFSLTVYETVNFMQPRRMNLWEERPRLSQKTLDILHRYANTEELLQAYDRDYWDPLVLHPDGPLLGRMSKQESRTIQREFIRYNVCQNLPAFISSRINIFLVSAMAQGGIVTVGGNGTRFFLNKLHTRSEYRPFDIPMLSSLIFTLSAWSFTYRIILWTPFIGIGLMALLLHRAWRRKDRDLALLLSPMILQLGGIFLFSTAGEYRYILPFFFISLFALPALACSRRDDRIA